MEKNPYYEYAESFKRLSELGKNLPFGEVHPPKNQVIREDSPTALILSPHPDDECIMGALPLRLMREAGFRVVTVAITLGSNLSRRKKRLDELKKACDWIGFELEEMLINNTEKTTPEIKELKPVIWNQKVLALKNVIEKWKPVAVFFPNSNDWNQTHLGVHLLTLDLLSSTESFFPFLIETEYWGQIPQPNLMVESTTQEVADLLAALSHHKGELERNPFHIRMPSWMQDNVRRGAEVVGGQGGKAPDFNFATLYRISRWNGKEINPVWNKGKILPAGKNSRDFLNSH